MWTGCSLQYTFIDYRVVTYNFLARYAKLFCLDNYIWVVNCIHNCQVLKLPIYGDIATAVELSGVACIPLPHLQGYSFLLCFNE